MSLDEWMEDEQDKQANTHDLKSMEIIIDGQKIEPDAWSITRPLRNFEGWGELRSACAEQRWGAVSDMLTLWHPRSSDAAHSLAASLGWIARGMDAQDLSIADKYDITFEGSTRCHDYADMRLERLRNEQDALHWWQLITNWGDWCHMRDVYDGHRLDQDLDQESLTFRLKFDGSVVFNGGHHEHYDVDEFDDFANALQASMWIAAVVMDRAHPAPGLCGADRMHCPVGVTIEAVEAQTREQPSESQLSMTINGQTITIDALNRTQEEIAEAFNEAIRERFGDGVQERVSVSVDRNYLTVRGQAQMVHLTPAPTAREMFLAQADYPVSQVELRRAGFDGSEAVSRTFGISIEETALAPDMLRGAAPRGLPVDATPFSDEEEE